MQSILQESRSKSLEIKSIYLAHRLGHVPTTQSSILVCVSSAHRREAFEICEEILEQVKKQVPIWKKEIYVGQNEGEAEWKANF
jgi:molybdopterin synthase catalytic subunit